MDLKGLESVFKKSGRPYWWLYKGNSKSTLLASYNGEDDIRPDIETSWQQLQEIVEEFGDGTYSVELKNNITQSRGTSFITFTIGEEKSVASKSDNFIQPGRFMAGLDMRYFLEQNTALQQQNFALQMQLLEQRFENSRLRDELDEPVKDDSVVGRLIGLVETNPAILGQIFGQEAAPAAIGVLKGVGAVPEPKKSSARPKEELPEQQGISIDRAVNCMVRLQSIFPEIHVNTLLEKLTVFCESNPQQANMLLNSI